LISDSAKAFQQLSSGSILIFDSLTSDNDALPTRKSAVKMMRTRFWFYLLLLLAMLMEKQYAFQTPSELVLKRPTSIISTRSSRSITSSPLLLPLTRLSSNQRKNPEDDASSSSFLFDLLASGRESDFKPGNANFFYNDEVVSHLHGYVFLVGLFFAQDPVRSLLADSSTVFY